jgi:hypothetical protein
MSIPKQGRNEKSQKSLEDLRESGVVDNLRNAENGKGKRE